ncbi:carbohydrate ABC transporter permease [Demequina muriae]|uniref:Sugar ABC transporter permease n=1 Tax=Demequina muriae TaxID=3051664 RepID=A0ABT8GEL5_9MICO|nr:sugar ABC transporter permease [Demequina sp. EGI L300058]MDN4479870.1 sugar ABC transporter permease [Demequina sp. EGI L300058]
MTMATDAPAVREVQPGGSRKPRNAMRRRNTLIGWSFILPNFLGFGLVTLIPVVFLFYMAFTEWSAFGDPEFLGFDNFTRLIGDGSFQTSLGNTLYYSVFHIPLTLVAALSLAMLLNTKLRGVAFFRTAAFFPYITAVVAIAAVWSQLFSADGVINQILGVVGLDPGVGWTADSTLAMPAVILVSVWRDTGFFMLLYLAGLQTVPRTLYEAARVDGASAWQRFWNVTWPCLRPTTFFVTVMLTIQSLKVFDLVFLLTAGGPGQSTFVLAQFIYQKGIVEFEYGYASAGAIVLFSMSLVVTIVQFLVNKRIER